MKNILCILIVLFFAGRTMAQAPKPPIKSGADRIPAKQTATLPISGGGGGSSSIHTVASTATPNTMASSSAGQNTRSTSTVNKLPLRSSDPAKSNTKQTTTTQTSKSNLPSAAAAPKVTQQAN